MKYQIIKGRIKGHHIGEIIELDENEGKAYGERYLKPIKEEKKEVKNASNKALTSEDTNTKGAEKN